MVCHFEFAELLEAAAVLGRVDINKTDNRAKTMKMLNRCCIVEEASRLVFKEKLIMTSQKSLRNPRIVRQEGSGGDGLSIIVLESKSSILGHSI